MRLFAKPAPKDSFPMPKLRVANRLTRLISRFVLSREANVAVMTAIVMVPTIYLLGMAMDFTQALRHRAQLDAATDAAAIAAVRPAMLMQSDAVAQATAAAVFATTANSIKGALTPSTAPTPTISIVDSGLQRTVTVSYNAASTNNFPILLGSATWPISGSSTAKAASAPNMNFYLLMDDSPSMGIGATTTDISNLITYTASRYQSAASSQNCGFACHETNIEIGRAHV